MTQRRKSTAEQLIELRRQLDFANKDLRIAIQCYELFKIAARDQALIKRVGRSYATGGFTVVRDALHREAVLALLRIWDNTRHTFRMAEFVRQLLDPQVRAAIISRRADAMMWTPIDLEHFEGEARPAMERRQFSDAADAGRKASRELVVLSRQVNRILSGDRKHVLDALERLRHRLLAHTEIRDWSAVPETQRPRARTAVYGDERQLIQWTKTILERLNVLVDDLHVTFGDTSRLYRKAAKHFWAPVRAEKRPASNRRAGGRRGSRRKKAR